MLLCKFDGIERLGERPNLVHFNEYGVANSLFYAFRKNCRVGAKNVVPDEFHLLAEFVGKRLPACPIVLGLSVFEQHDGILTDPGRPESHHFVRGLLRLVRLKEELTVIPHLARRRVKADGNILARLVSRFGDRIQNDLDRAVVAADGGSVTVTSRILQNPSSRDSFSFHYVDR